MAFSSAGVKENAKNDSVVGKFTTVDPDINQTHFYTLLDYDCKFIRYIEILSHNSLAQSSVILTIFSVILVTFYIKESELLVKDSNRLDYENQTQISIHVRTTDNGFPPLFRQV